MTDNQITMKRADIVTTTLKVVSLITTIYPELYLK